MPFINPMWDSESERIGKQKCTRLGYALHEIPGLFRVKNKHQRRLGPSADLCVGPLGHTMRFLRLIAITATVVVVAGCATSRKQRAGSLACGNYMGPIGFAARTYAEDCGVICLQTFSRCPMRSSCRRF